jgi:hypothetical protein
MNSGEELSVYIGAGYAARVLFHLTPACPDLGDDSLNAACEKF